MADKKKTKYPKLTKQPKAQAPRTGAPKTKIPVLTRKPEAPEKWRFSFQYWEEIPYFEVGNVSKSWFAGLLGRLRQLSKEEMAPFFDGSGAGAGNGYRFHPIDFNHTNCPVDLASLNWLDRDIVENREEFELYQIAVSKSLGRIVGYLQKEVFYIVLLDPAHNLQPSKSYGFRVDKTHPSCCQLSKMIATSRLVSTALKNRGESDDLRLAAMLDNAEADVLCPNSMLHFVSQEQKDVFERCADENNLSLVDLMEFGLLYFEETQPRST